VEFQRPAESPDYWIINAQVTKFFKKWELYLGGENLTNYMQHHPIIEADNPFGEYFDATIVWAPIMGVVVYSGIRFTIQ
jgi:outer membrane receptor for ferrienterochelin and colicins